MITYGIILASGTGSRYGSEIPKQFTKINDKTIFEHTIYAFEKSVKIDRIIAVVTPSYLDFANNLIAKNVYKKIFKVIPGGEARKDSSFLGISTVPEDEANILIHDCARPFISQNIINKCIECLEKHTAVGVGIPTTDTLWEVENGTIKSIPNRKKYYRAQTPQCFKLSLIKKAHELSKDDNDFTDDCSLVIKYKLSDIYIVEGDNQNIKITYPEDIIWAENIIKNRP